MWDRNPVDPAKAVEVLDLLPAFPVVLVSTRDNLLTVSMVHYFTFRPLRFGVAIHRARHSFGLIQAEGEFVINVPGREMLEAVKACGKLSGRDGPKFPAVGLTPLPSLAVGAVGVAECGAQIECRVCQEIPFEERVWFVGEVMAARAAPGWEGRLGLLCGRHDYRLTGEAVTPR